MQVRTCEICGKRSARYVCQECGREVCEVCLEPHIWICSDCYSRLKREVPAPKFEAFPWPTPLKLFLLGFLLIFIGMIVMMITAVFFGAPTTPSTGAVIWIFPLPPIAIGAGPYSIWALILAVILTILGVILFVMLRRQES